MKHFIIIANGDFLVKEIIQEAIQEKIIIALDGAANKLERIGIMPHIILGDFDSISPTQQQFWGIKKTFVDLHDNDEPYIGNHHALIIPAKNQNKTDLAKAVQYCDDNQAMSITIICATGGRLDLHQSNMMILESEYKSDRPIVLHTDQQTIRYAKDEAITFHGNKNEYCGIIPTPGSTYTTNGLTYDVSNHEKESLCNSLNENKAKIAIHGGATIIMTPQLSSQREFMQKSEAQQLQMRLRDMKMSSLHDQV